MRYDNKENLKKWFLVVINKEKTASTNKSANFSVHVHSSQNQNINLFTGKDEDLIEQIKKLINKLLQKTKPHILQNN